MATSRRMTVEEWIKVEDNPIQRDTERHALKAKHLHTPHPTHAFVFAAEMPSGKLIKLDGHTRALLWRRKEVEAPPSLTVGLIPVENREEAERLYKDFDSREALETMRDKVSGAFNRHNFEPQSGLLQSGSITQALRMAYGVLIGGSVKTSAAGGMGPGMPIINRRSEKQMLVAKADIYHMINEFSYELHALDGFGLGQGKITSGVMAAFILSYRKYGHKITPFWKGVFGGKGSKMDGQMDAIQAVEVMMMAWKGKGGKMHTADLAARCLRAVEAFLKDEMFYRVPTPLDTTAYLLGHEATTERLIKARDIKRA